MFQCNRCQRRRGPSVPRRLPRSQLAATAWLHASVQQRTVLCWARGAADTFISAMQHSSREGFVKVRPTCVPPLPRAAPLFLLIAIAGQRLLPMHAASMGRAQGLSGEELQPPDANQVSRYCSPPPPPPPPSAGAAVGPGALPARSPSESWFAPRAWRSARGREQPAPVEE